ncbi:proline--tRNA ligase [Mycoplasma sp. M5725]|uniref:Proline--tRNA ligase n=1 Tax=Mycoplasma phocimorsus TaxID=3045839 RepID=A0AAJ1PQQ8_9MOLU|nr:proline--tRNA ligase [Mycoplasma phocimorsus]MDJ1645604.1 proline--tRNA ligase [Mycoplasma phocimorsus]
MKKLDKITPQNQDFAKWYVDVVKNGNLIDYGLVKGTIMFKPNGYGIWENIQSILDNIFKKNGVSNVYLPMLIPQSQFAKEKNHIQGFNPELATITKVGNKPLYEDIYIRPTSEVIFAELFKRDIDKNNELPLIFNQWTNVIRWEKTTTPFLRNSEFLWQEGHTVHADPLEARKLTRKMLFIYEKFLKDYLAIPSIAGKKTPREKFAGACSTYTIEVMTKNGRALQCATSHYLAQNFSKPYDIKFKNKENQFEYVYQTSWGTSTRLIGAIIMNHGDDRGIVIPPYVAKNQIDILTIFGNKNPQVIQKAKQLYNQLSSKFRVRLDDSDKQPGFKSSQSEIEGTPIRIEIGPKDLENETITVVRRDTLEKSIVNFNEINATFFNKLMEKINKNLYNKAAERLNKKFVCVNTYNEFKEKIAQGYFVSAPFDGDEIIEEQIQNETGASARCVKIKQKIHNLKPCIITGNYTKKRVIFAKSY